MDNIRSEVSQPNDPVFKSLNSLANQGKRGNYEAQYSCGESSRMCGW